LATRIRLVALILATILSALSYWLLGQPHRKA
jgi:lipopolysaccharide export system protein LptC